MSKKSKRGKRTLGPKGEAKLVERLADKVRRGELTIGQAKQEMQRQGMRVSKKKRSLPSAKGVGIVQTDGARRVGDSQAVYRKHSSFKKKP